MATRGQPHHHLVGVPLKIPMMLETLNANLDKRVAIFRSSKTLRPAEKNVGPTFCDVAGGLAKGKFTVGPKSKP